MTTNNGYHTAATGEAATTASAHSTTHSLKLYGACFCPFVQRVWIQLEVGQFEYQYVEVDPYAKPEALLKLSPKGLVPALQDTTGGQDDGEGEGEGAGVWGCHESTVIMDYLEELRPGTLLPDITRGGRGQKVLQYRADQKRWAHFVNSNIVPGFYRLLQAQEEEEQIKHGKELLQHVITLTEAMDEQGPFFGGETLGYVDAMVAPWVVRFEKVLKPYRGWSPERSGRWGRFVDALLNNDAVKRTTSDDQLYLDSYKRYAENRPNTSQVANAINAGRSLP